MRLLPELTPENTAFWTGGERGELVIVHCDACDHAIHPPEPICPKCLSRQVSTRIAKGTGTIYTYTINHQVWLPGMKVPYALVCVDLDGEAGVRLTAELADGDLDKVAIGQRVKVIFDKAAEDVWVPQFVRADAA